MKLVGVGNQMKRDYSYFADGSIIAAQPQLLLPEANARSALWIQNTSSATMWIGLGSARATATITNGAVTAVTMVNQGFNFTVAPNVLFMGGGIQPAFGIHPANSSYVGATGPTYPSPQHPATGHAVLTGGKVTSIVIDDPGAGYVKPPYVFISNSDLDPNGCFDPSVGGGAGFQLYPGNSWTFDSSVCFTDPVAIFCATPASTFACWYTT